MYQRIQFRCNVSQQVSQIKMQQGEIWFYRKPSMFPPYRCHKNELPLIKVELISRFKTSSLISIRLITSRRSKLDGDTIRSVQHIFH